MLKLVCFANSSSPEQHCRMLTRRVLNGLHQTSRYSIDRTSLRTGAVVASPKLASTSARQRSSLQSPTSATSNSQISSPQQRTHQIVSHLSSSSAVNSRAHTGTWRSLLAFQFGPRQPNMSPSPRSRHRCTCSLTSINRHRCNVQIYPPQNWCAQHPRAPHLHREGWRSTFAFP